MELFDEGGLMQEGGTVDPISGNDVPVGSTQEEVRDDIPAQLSEGEFVMPADVVRYHGLDKMMALRDEAKMGLQRMKDMGQMGNSEEAIIPDGIPFSMEDLELEEEPMEMQVGGAVLPNVTTTNTYSQPSMFANYQQTPANQPLNYNSGYNNYGSFFGQPYGNINPVFTEPVPGGTTTKPPYSFGDLIPAIGGTSETREYRNQAGQSLYIPFINGEPVYPIPDGYTEYKPEDIVDVAPDPELPTDINVGDNGNNRDDIIPSTSTINTGDFNLSGMLGRTKSKAYNEAVNSLALNQLSSLSPIGAIASTISGTSSPNTKGIMMNQSRLNAAGIFGIKDINTASVEELDNIGNIMKVANNFALEDNSLYNSIKTGTPAGVNKETVDRAVATISGSLAEAVNQGVITGEELAGIATLERDKTTGAYKSASGKTVGYKTTDGKTVNIDKSVMDYVNAMLSTDDQMTPTEKANSRAATIEAANRDAIRDSAKAKSVSRATVSTASGLNVEDRIAQTANALMSRGMTATDALNAATRAEKTGRIDADTSAAFNVTPTATKASVSYSDNDRNDSSEPSGVSVGRGEDSPSAARDSSRSTGVSVGRGEDSPTAARDAAKAKESSNDSGSSSDKIVCTAMNNAYGFGSFRQAIWLHHSKDMDPAYQKGYHRIFRPLIKVAYRNTKWYNIAVRKMLEGIARRRTADIWMQKKGKRHFVGAIERAILEPICYIVGKIK